MLSVLLRRLGVEMNGVGCVGLSMMISGKGGILLIKEIVLIMLEIEVRMVMVFFKLGFVWSDRLIFLIRVIKCKSVTEYTQRPINISLAIQNIVYPITYKPSQIPC